MRTSTEQGVLIADARGRRFLSRLSGRGWIAHDRRWRRRREVFGATTRVFQGAGSRVLVQDDDGVTRCRVFEMGNLDSPLAAATYDGSWHFEGPSQVWAEVPEYLLVEAGETGKTRLLRIADGAVADDLEEIGRVDVVSVVPDSRLLLLAGGGRLTVWDPEVCKALAHLRLRHETPYPYSAFRHGSAEVLVDDADVLMKLETRQWRPVDAAGSSDDGGEIEHWIHDPVRDRCFVARVDDCTVIGLDAETLLPVTTTEFRAPVKALVSRQDDLYVLTSDDELESARIHPG